MTVHLTQWHQEATCTWCEKSRECVTTEFGDGFLKASPLCWACLQKAVKVRSRQDKPSAAASPSAADRTTK